MNSPADIEGIYQLGRTDKRYPIIAGLIGAVVIADLLVAFYPQLLGILLLLLVVFTFSLLNPRKYSISERMVFTVALVNAVLLLFGWFLNTTLSLFGYPSPLSVGVVFIMANIILGAIILLHFVYYKKGPAVSELNPSFTILDKAVLIIPCLLPLLSAYGTFLARMNNEITLSIIVYLLIPVSILIIAYFHQRLHPDVFGIALILISFSLLAMFWLRSDHILGHDVHTEYYIFRTTLFNEQWSQLLQNPLDACLSISLLPTIYHNLLNIAANEQVFKGVYAITCSFTPLAVYALARKYTQEIYAFFAGIFFIFYPNAVVAAGSPRTNIAIFFIAVFILVLFYRKMVDIENKFLLISFVFAIVVSHYTSSFLFLFVLVFAFIGFFLIKFRLHLQQAVSNLFQRINTQLLILSVSILLGWYAFLSGGPLSAGYLFIKTVTDNLSSFFQYEARNPELYVVFGTETGGKPLLSFLNLFVVWGTFLFIAIGVLGLFWYYRRMVDRESRPPTFFKSWVDVEFHLLALASCLLLGITAAVPYISIGYGAERVYTFTLVFLSVFFAIGGIFISRKLRINPIWLILVIMVPYFLFNTGMVYELQGQHTNWYLSSDTTLNKLEFVQNQEVTASSWITDHLVMNRTIFTTDVYGQRKLISQADISPDRINERAFSKGQMYQGYLFFTYYNTVEGSFVDPATDESESITTEISTYYTKNKDYGNGGAEIWS